MADNTQPSRRSARNPWLPPSLNGGSGHTATHASPPGHSETEEWLPSATLAAPLGNGRSSRNGKRSRNGKAAQNGGGGSAEPAAKPEPHVRRRRHKLPKHASPRERWLIFRLRRSRRREEELRARIEELQARVAELEQQVKTRNGGAPKAETSNGNGNGSKPERSSAPKKRAESPAKSRKPSAAQAKRSRSSTAKATRPRTAKPVRPRANGTNGKRSKLDLNAATFDELRELGLSITQTSRLISHREMGGGFDRVEELDEIKGLSQETVAELRTQVRV